MDLALSLPLLLIGLAQTPSEAPADPAFGEAALLQVEQMTEAQREAWQSYLLPTSEELAFASLPWRSTFADGLRDADALGKPLLLWVMNGHPLGCT